MRVPVLYGTPDSSEFQRSADYVAKKLGLTLKQTWDGNADQEVEQTGEEIRKNLLEFVPENNISFSPEDRFSHSLGRSSPEILMAREGSIERIVDAVIFPDYKNVAGILKELRLREFRAIIYGGGSSVSGSLLVNSKGRVVSIDTKNFRQMSLDQGFAVIGSGYRGMEAETVLNRYGYTLGNFPESMLHSTIGGWVATKAIGQESNQYGGIENLVLGVNLAKSDGELSEEVLPRKSSGFDYKDIAIGSDGKYGIITDVALKLFKRPERRFFSSRIYASFKDGIDALSKSQKFPAVARLSDELETEFALNTAGDSTSVKIFRKYVSMRTHGTGALLVVVNNDFVVNPVLTNSISTGSAPAKSWIRGRFSRPGIANVLWKNGLVPDTLETSATWENLYTLYTKTRETFYRMREELGFKGEIMAHVSHLYRSGACIYFTFIISSQNDVEVLSKVRDGMVECFISNHGSVTHHHGKGTFFSKYLDSQLVEMQGRLEDPLFAGERPHD